MSRWRAAASQSPFPATAHRGPRPPAWRPERGGKGCDKKAGAAWVRHYRGGRFALGWSMAEVETLKVQGARGVHEPRLGEIGILLGWETVQTPATLDVRRPYHPPPTATSDSAHPTHI